VRAKEGRKGRRRKSKKKERKKETKNVEKFYQNKKILKNRTSQAKSTQNEILIPERKHD
jgi:hypothetical protein